MLYLYIFTRYVSTKKENTKNVKISCIFSKHIPIVTEVRLKIAIIVNINSLIITLQNKTRRMYSPNRAFTLDP